MRITLSSLTIFLIFKLGDCSLASANADLRSRAEDTTDDLDEWLATAKRVSPEALKACPSSCSAANNITSRAGWFLFPDPTKLALCNETMLLDMVVKSASTEESTQPIVRACSAGFDSDGSRLFEADDEKASLCTTANRVLERTSVYVHQPQVANDFSVNHLISASQQMKNHLALQQPSCTNNAMEFAYSQSSTVGLFAGAEIHQHGMTMDILEKFMVYAREKALTKTTIVQLCPTDKRGADYSFGIVATSAKNLAFVQEVVKTWASGSCVSQVTTGEQWMEVNLRVPTPTNGTAFNGTNSTVTLNSRTPARFGARSRLTIRADCRTTSVQSGDGCWAVADRCGISQSDLEKYNRANLCNTLVKDEKVCCGSGTLPNTLPGGNSDGTCKTREVVSGDSCGTLASKCGISADDFMKANTKNNLCSSLAEGQQVCCSNGKLPDLKPKPDSNGNCAVYTTKKDDNCAKIAASRDLSTKDLEDFNKKTWGWNGCQLLWPDYKMCVSSGSPPMPANVPNAVCGPTMNGTTQPPAGTDLAKLNPCPLNVCCNIWGQCGMTDDFCVISKSESGAPGTSAPGKNGCISNCGRDIIKGSAPASKIKVAYFESWNFNRKCLTMNVNEIDTTQYTHIHFAFPNVTRGDYKVEITDPGVKKQFELFKAMSGVKKIVSLGGWAFSTEPGTFSILREAAQPANREKFKTNLIAFMNEHNLDGIDLDWEYPGAPDIPGIPKDDPVNGVNYYRLLSSLKSTVGSSKTVSFAAPASYWYLKSFPIKNMAEALDYIIYMTYDLHGQWDYGNKWTSPGCPNGDCLRSHVNETETKDALSMITKAGAASNKVVVGVSSYGRSFKMAQSGCDSEDCKFTGSSGQSNAAKGRCTDTAGYISNAEINEIILSGKVNKKWTKEGSNMMVYNDTEWVAWMDDEMKKSRSRFYDTYNFAGTTDWAVDLQKFTDGSGGNEDDDYEGYEDPNYWSDCTGKYSTLKQLEDAKDALPSHCVDQYIADVEVAVHDGALEKYKTLVDNGYDKKFEIYEKFVRAQIPEQINNFMATDKVDKYFKCQETKFGTCCNKCRFDNCLPGCIKGSNCKGGQGVYDIACPRMEFEDKGLTVGTYIPNATFVLKDSDGFYKDLESTWGIEQSWITFDRRLMRIENGCQHAGEDVQQCMRDKNTFFHNYPRPSDKVSIYNPKKIIGDSYPKSKEMLDRFKTMKAVGPYDGDLPMTDLVDAISIPSFFAVEAIEAMEKIVAKADEIKKKEREEMIMNFILGLLFFIPVAGEAAGAAGLTAARSLLRLIGSVGDIAMTVYDVVQDPKNAFLAVFMHLAGAGVGRTGFRNAAQARRGMSAKEYASLGPVKAKMDSIINIRGNTCKL
ncbi:putative glycosyl hydrolase, family 18 [Ophiobolus disseminans]|uniref:chitinase n=1 Tax=Ophiobolus disseminans TaxID=1469910 RepID=A0A6A6ZGP0_9PLEO|nr:putative glycosyl hydrolase, family 18 [Ophiobolus disseminans]